MANQPGNDDSPGDWGLNFSPGSNVGGMACPSVHMACAGPVPGFNQWEDVSMNDITGVSVTASGPVPSAMPSSGAWSSVLRGQASVPEGGVTPTSAADDHSSLRGPRRCHSSRSPFVSSSSPFSVLL